MAALALLFFLIFFLLWVALRSFRGYFVAYRNLHFTAGNHAAELQKNIHFQIEKKKELEATSAVGSHLPDRLLELEKKVAKESEGLERLTDTIRQATLSYANLLRKVTGAGMPEQ